MNTDVKPVGTAKRPPRDDRDETAAPPPPARQGFLPTGLSRAIVIGSVLISMTAAAATLLPHRYHLVAAARSENALVYRIDSLTGRVSLCSAAQCAEVAEKE